MKTTITLIFFILGLIYSYSQDVITLKNGTEINGKITEVGTKEIKYQKTNMEALYVIDKSEIFMIKYSDGTKDVFKDEEPSEIKQEVKQPEVKTVEQTKSNSSDDYTKGSQDAKMYYPARHCGVGGTVLATIFATPIGGAIVAGACSASEPSMQNLSIPNMQLATTSSEYMRGYKEAAHKKKIGKLWKAFGITVGVELAIILLFGGI